MVLTAVSVDEVASGSRVYRAYHLDQDGDFRSVTVLRVLTDDEARIAAKELTSAFGVHLWERARFLGDFPPQGAPPRG